MEIEVVVVIELWSLESLRSWLGFEVGGEGRGGHWSTGAALMLLAGPPSGKRRGGW